MKVLLLITTIGGTPTEVVPGEMISTEVNITITSAPPGNGHNISLGDHFSYIIPDQLDFTETPALTAPSVRSSQ